MEWQLSDVYVDGVMRMEIIGDLVRMINFRYTSERGAIIKLPVLSVIRPVATVWGRLENAGCEIIRLTERPKLSA